MESPAQYRELAPMTESSSRYESASKLPERAAFDLKRVAAEMESALARPRQVHQAASRATLLLLRPGGAREAMIASIILGPPKALEASQAG
jgi:hypothetical protein